ncbi:ATP synthase F1 subunit epsilon [Patescibacteria group bacterium]|nr:ATP synthase F1 subunit epsilon [Patescibacteria group bacterium]
MAFPLRIFSIDREVFIGQVHSVTVPGASGQMQVLPDHTPLVSLLKEGDIIIETENKQEQKIPIRGGTIEVNDKEVVALVNF